MNKTKFFAGILMVFLLAGCGLPFGADDNGGGSDEKEYVSMTSDEKEVNEGLKESVLKIRTGNDSAERSFLVEIADTFSTRRIGLMHRTQMDVDRGMLFVFEDESMQSFWMKNTLIPLDMVFINDNEKIVHIARNVQPCTGDPCPSYPSEKPARYVLELNGGVADASGIQEGDTVYLDI